jgi:MATE family multidrug resistance protein
MEEQSCGAEAKVPLLEPRAAAEHHHNETGGGVVVGKAEEAEWSAQPLRRRAWEENKRLWVVAGPSICARFASFGVTVISQAFIGHIGATELAAYALVSTVLMRFSNGILVTNYILHRSSCSPSNPSDHPVSSSSSSATATPQAS